MDAKLTLDYGGVSVERILKDLGFKCGLEITAAPPMKSEVVLLICNQRPASEVLKEIAETTQGR